MKKLSPLIDLHLINCGLICNSFKESGPIGKILPQDRPSNRTSQNILNTVSTIWSSKWLRNINIFSKTLSEGLFGFLKNSKISTLFNVEMLFTYR